MLQGCVHIILRKMAHVSGAAFDFCPTVLLKSCYHHFHMLFAMLGYVEMSNIHWLKKYLLKTNLMCLQCTSSNMEIYSLGNQKYFVTFQEEAARWPGSADVRHVGSA